MIDRIIVRGARQHNLKNINVEIPRNRLTVITGLSGSGKSSLAFDTIYAEGQRRYVETLSPYARQFLDQMERPDVDSIEGLSPALSIEQKTTNRSPRSTVGTITEIYDYLRLLYSSIGTPHCPDCDIPICRQSAGEIAQRVLEERTGKQVMVLAPVVRGRKGEFKREFDRLAQLGFLRARVDGEMVQLDEDIPLDRQRNHTIEVLVDRLKIRAGLEKRLTLSIQTATKLGDGLVLVAETSGAEQLYSEKLACTRCGRSVPTLEPRSFSFNSPYGACESCTGLGTRWEFDPEKVIADRTKPLLGGGIEPGLLPPRVERSLTAGAKRLGIGLTKSYDALSGQQQVLLLRGEDPDEAAKAARPFRGLLRLLEEWNDTYATENFRAWLTRFRSANSCPACRGRRLRPESLAVKVAALSIAEFAALPIDEAARALAGFDLSERQRLVAGRIVEEVRRRLGFLSAVGLDYLSLGRAAATLSSGEAQRVRLATQIGSELRGVLYVLDEPSIGLHARDNDRLLKTLARLRDLGNTIIVVEHDLETIERADYVVDLGVGAGRLGGDLVACGTPKQVAANSASLTGQYLSGARQVPLPETRRSSNGKQIVVRAARQHNLKSIDATFPLGMFTVVTGVSGSGKSTLVNGILYPALARKIYRSSATPGRHRSIEGMEHIDKVILIDQSPIGRTPRSNPATYTGAFTPIREIYAMLPESRVRGYQQGRFSFNVKGGRCEACRGDGQSRIEMNFLPDVFVTCDTCRGRRYNHETLQVKFKGRSIAGLLESTVEEVLPLMENIPKVHAKLKTLVDVGLGYLHLGQSSTTLSGGEAQRIKLAKELSKRQTGRTLYILDEPTTGLHFEDVKKLLEVLFRFTELNNTVIVIEHNLDVIKAADWIIDLGPEGGDQGGEIVACGTPEQIVQSRRSYTGKALAKVLARG